MSGVNETIVHYFVEFGKALALLRRRIYTIFNRGILSKLWHGIAPSGSSIGRSRRDAAVSCFRVRVPPETLLSRHSSHQRPVLEKTLVATLSQHLSSCNKNG